MTFDSTIHRNRLAVAPDVASQSLVVQEDTHIVVVYFIMAVAGTMVVWPFRFHYVPVKKRDPLDAGHEG